MPARPATQVGIVPYSPLARGLLAARVAGRADLDAADRRLAMPRFADGALERNAARAARLAAAAAARACTPAQLALAWLMAPRGGAAVVPIPGSKTPARVEENMAAVALAARLTPADLAELEALDLQARAPARAARAPAAAAGRAGNGVRRRGGGAAAEGGRGGVRCV